MIDHIAATARERAFWRLAERALRAGRAHATIEGVDVVGIADWFVIEHGAQCGPLPPCPVIVRSADKATVYVFKAGER